MNTDPSLTDQQVPADQPTTSQRALVPAEIAQPGSVEEEVVAQPAKLMRIASMARQLLEEVRMAPLDDASRRARARGLTAPGTDVPARPPMAFPYLSGRSESAPKKLDAAFQRLERVKGIEPSS